MQTDLENHAEAQEVLKLMDNLLAGAEGVTVANDAEMEQASALLRDIKALQKKAEAAQKGLTQPLEKEKKGIIAWFRERITNKLSAGESQLKRAILAYQQEQDRIRREEQRKAEEAARKERERLERRAAAAAEKGQQEKAEQLAEQAETVVAPVHQEATKVQGISTRSVWRFEITDPKAIPREYLMVDEQKIGKVVRALKGDTEIPGVRVYEEKSLAAAG